jgi:hypothetical protein
VKTRRRRWLRRIWDVATIILLFWGAATVEAVGNFAQLYFAFGLFSYGALMATYYHRGEL